MNRQYFKSTSGMFLMKYLIKFDVISYLEVWLVRISIIFTIRMTDISVCLYFSNPVYRMLTDG